MICFETNLKVRTYECDIYGHVNNATFLNYCEAARIEFLNHLGYSLIDLRQKGWLLPIVKIVVDYKRPVFAEEKIKVTVSWKKRRQSSAIFEQEIIKEKSGEVAAKVVVTWVATDLKNNPVPVPKEMLDRIYKEYNELPEKE